jgi:outer membrane receptor for ferrienterochelin and colicins
MKSLTAGRAALLLLTLMAVPSASAQTAAAVEPPATRSYVAADFVQFVPKSALDMLQRVPGFAIRSEDTDRGLGEASGNVLVNGQRISGKSNDVLSELGRIPAKNVERIEIVDGATLGIQGLTGQIANVIVRSTGISGQYGYYPEFRQYYTDPRLTRFDLSASGTRGAVEYTLGVDNRSSRSGAGGSTYISNAAGERTEYRNEEWHSNYDIPRISGKFGFDGPGGSAGNLNLSYSRLIYEYLEDGMRTGTLDAERDRSVRSKEEGDIYEIGGDWELGFGPGRLKLIAVHNGSSIPSETDVITTYREDSSVVGDRFTGTGDERESIGRGEYRWKQGAADWQISAEAAFNSLDNTSQLFSMDADGGWTEIPFPGATTTVEEDRYEVMGSYGRSLTPNIVLKLSAGGEYSKLAAGNGSDPRSFTRPKGEISTAWKVSPVMDVNVKLARRVGQLNFYDFLASVNLRDDSETSANPDLVPQQSWDLDIEGVRNLGSLGSTTLKIYGQLIDDIIDYVPIGEDGQAPGNLDRATVYGISSRSTFNLDRIGFRGARVDAFLQYEDSEVEDPLTGEKRPISNNLMRGAELSIRHDIPKSELAWGFGSSYYYSAKEYRLTQVGRQWEGPVWANLYFEHKNILGLTVRASVNNLFAADSMWDRTVYNGWRTGGNIAYVERRDRVIGPIYSLSIRGKF